MKSRDYSEAERKSLQGVLARRNFQRQIDRMKKEAERMEKRANKKRVRKPKPIRRHKELVTIISIGGVPVDGVEDGCKEQDA